MFRSLWRILTTVIFVITSMGAVLFFVFFYFGRGLPDYQFLRDYQPSVVSRFYTNDYQLFKEHAREKRIFVAIENIPPLLVQAFLSAEDKNFYYHPGVDLISVFRAALNNTFKGAWNGKALGASTITQQVAKNFLVGNERSFDRKFREAIMSMRLEMALSKERILELYLNQIYLGMGSYGVAAAAQTYFGKSLDKLTIAECAFLASLPKAPATYHPIKEQKRAKARRDWVVGRLAEDNIVSSQEAQDAQNDPFKITLDSSFAVNADYFGEEVRREIMQRFGENMLYTGGLSVFTTLDPNLQRAADKSLRKGLEEYDRRHGWRGVVAKITQLDQSAWIKDLNKIPPVPGMNDAKLAVVLAISSDREAKIGFANGAVSSLFLTGVEWARLSKPDGTQGPEIKKISEVIVPGDVILVNNIASSKAPLYELHQIPLVSGGIVVMDADTGNVLAMTGGYSFEISQFNCATQAWRQPGSAFKPFVYLAAMEKGYTPETLINDAPITLSLGPGLGVYSPKNITHRSYGPSPMRIGIEKSYNLMTVRLAHQIGMQPVKSIATRFGVADDMPLHLSNSLGAKETTVLRLTTAYAMIVNGGKKIKPNLIKQVQDRNGQVIHQLQTQYGEFLGQERKELLNNWHDVEEEPLPELADQRKQIIDVKFAESMTTMLEAVVQRGTGKKLQPLMEKYNITLGGKTGSTNDCKDAWFMGFIRYPNGRTLIVGVFVGYPTPQTLGTHQGADETGTRVALPVFGNFVREIFYKK
ncbi:MAG: PBP1A family penicillin-binding protein [Alphaproteobacteria bacterium]|nr:PBP1A family penicillin-binding protein [Alphaproteobacteria bacterium]